MQLPIDVLEGVIDLACDNPTSLRHLSLTCTEFLPRARYHLFTGIVIQTMEQMLSSRDFLDARPWLLPLVREVTLSSSVYRNTDSEDRAEQTAQLLHVVPTYLFTHFPNLRVWRMRASTNFPHKERLSFHRSALRCYNICTSHIHHLELYRIQFNGMSDFAGLVSAFTSIHTLACSSVQLLEAKGNNSSQNTLRTRSLQIVTLQVSLSLIYEHLRD